MQLNNQTQQPAQQVACPKHTTGGGPCYCPGSAAYEFAREEQEKKVLAVIAREHPEAGELYIVDNRPSGGRQREVHGRGTGEHGTDRQGVYLCVVGSVLWDCYALHVEAEG
ncbi:MAG: hypothetical protein OQK32_00470 [Gammaproteobacteria bacterium]|nr:hypothetical protein [Gammaproteobacteria bacterium]MCW8924090.1 hypothetical protein [Gammaproteobacteria bacterium]